MTSPPFAAPSSAAAPATKPSESGCLYIVGGLSYIPLIGVPFGLIAIVAGLVTWRRGGWKLAAIGVGGLLFTVAIYGTLFYLVFVQRGGIYDGLRAQLAQQQLGQLVRSIEFYRLQHGAYPATLREVAAEDDSVMIVDTTDMGFTSGATTRVFYYELDASKTTYYLFSIGADGQPFTKDDLLPAVQPTETAGGGYRVRPLRESPDP